MVGEHGVYIWYIPLLDNYSCVQFYVCKHSNLSIRGRGEWAPDSPPPGSAPELGSPSTSQYQSWVNLLKIDVPMFNRNILHWNTFWRRQFDVSIHSMTQLTNVEKLAYLRHALKGGLTNQAIERLSQSADQYEEANGCLKWRYARSCLRHWAHVRAILDALLLKKAMARIIRRPYNVANQHLQVLVATKQDITETITISMLELKLNQATMFEWQRHSQDSNDVLQYSALVNFIDLRAQASENTFASQTTSMERPQPE